MTDTTRPTPAEIRAFRAENPKMRERDIAAQLGISEAALVAAEVGLTAVRIDGDANRFLERSEALGEVMALTRNESVVHEKIVVFEKINTGKHASIVLGENIDLRIFPGTWAHGFAVTKTDGDQVRRSLQFFDKAGDAVHKVYKTDATDAAAWQAYIDRHAVDAIAPVTIEPVVATQEADVPADGDAFRTHWRGLKDTHDFFSMLRQFKVSRLGALRTAGQDLAQQVNDVAVETVLHRAAETGLPIMCFVANRGIVQIHTGPVKKLVRTGPWFNVLDPSFNLHLNTEAVVSSWVVNKPTVDGWVTSLELYGASGELIVQFFGERKPGKPELGEWRALLQSLCPVALAA